MSAETPRSWHGWSRGSTALHIGHVPTRKSLTLYSMVGSVMYVHAYFRSEKEARRAMSVLDLITDSDPLESGIWEGDS